MRWLKKRFKEKRLLDRAAEKHKDYQRPVRICQRLQLRINALADNGKTLAKKNDWDRSQAATDRMDVLITRMRRVRDFQIKEWGY